MRKISLILFAAVCAGLSCSPKLSPDATWANQRWVLIEMKGVPVQLSGTRKDAFLEFAPQDKRFTGNAGCNRISGNYTLEKKDRIKLGEVISTKMSCGDIAFETTFLSTFNTVDRFETQGTILSLKDNKKVVLKFEQKPPSR
ncbi:MAG: META domain-containing protein [Chitinophagaceae bacterium]